MKEYLYNKDFLPKSFVISKNNNINCVNKRDSIILTVIACILLPISIGNIKSDFKETVPAINYNNIDEIVESASLYSWLSIVDKCFEGSFTKEQGNIYVYDKQKLEDILQDENIVINTMEDLGENKYRLQIVQKDNK